MRENVIIAEQNNRIDWIDMAKGYGILFVILGHLDEGDIVGTWIYTFHMPLFFFLSGYVFSTKYDFKTFIKRKFKSIIIPYFSLGIVIISFFSGSTISLLLNLVIQRRMLVLWYIACLFWLNLFFYFIVTKINSIKKIYIIVVGMLIIGLMYYKLGGVPLPWNIDVILPSSIFFFSGYVFKIHYSNVLKAINKSKSIICFYIAVSANLIFGYIGIKISGKSLQMYQSSYGFPPFTILSAFAGIFSVIIFSHWFNLRIVRYIGKNSLIYYAWHKNIMIPIVQYILKCIGITCNENSSIYSFVCIRIIELILILILCTICHLLISNSKLKFMIGK